MVNRSPISRAAIWTPIAVEGLTNQMMKGNGMGTGWKGLYTTSLLDYHANWRTRADELSDSLKICMFIGEYYLRHHRGHYYAKSQNLARKLRAAYDAMLGAYDLLLMPTLPMKATPLPPPDASLALFTQRAFEMVTNTCPFDVTGHPAMSIPCGMNDGLPVGMMLIGRHWNESTIYQAAHAEGMIDLRQDGYRKARQGVTTLDEVQRIAERRHMLRPIAARDPEPADRPEAAPAPLSAPERSG